MDIFYEYNFKKVKTAAFYVKTIASTLLAILLTLLLAFIYLIGLDIFGFCFLLIFLTWWGYITLIKNLNVEYEFAITNHELDIDIIKGKSKRKHIATIDLRKCDFFGNKDHPDTIAAMNESGKPTKEYYYVKDISSDYIFVTDVISRINGSKIRVFIEPDETLAEYIRLANPKAFKGTL